MNAAYERIVGINESMKQHTYLLWLVGALMLYVTLVQFHDSWEGDMWAFPEYDWMIRHEWVEMVDEILGPIDEDGYSLSHFYNDSGHGVTVHGPDHPSHASHIRKLLESQWETTSLTWVVHLNFLLIPSIFARYYFCWRRQTLTSIFSLMWIFMISSLAQFIAIGLRSGVIIFTFSLWALSGISLNFLCLCIEVAAYVELYHARSMAMFMNDQYKQLPEEHQTLIGAELDARTAREQKKERKRRSKRKNAFSFVNSIVHMLTAARNSINEDCTARRFNLPPKEKIN